MKRSLQSNVWLAPATVFLVVMFMANIAIGSVKIPLSDVLSIIVGNNHESVWSDIIWQFRMPKAVTCILAGCGLAAGGLMMQSWFRNPLAGPDVLGLSSGASLMVALVILAGSTSFAPISRLISSPWSVAIAASIGSCSVFLLVIVLAQKVRNNASLLIIGLMLSAATASIVSVLQFLSTADDLQAFMIWTMGSVGATGWPEIRVLFFIVVAGASIAFYSLKSLNALLLGEGYAQSIGVNVRRARILIVLSTSILTGAVTAFCGPIAFVGLAVPHLIRSMMPTSNHKILLPGVMIGGASLILFCDILTQLPGSTQILPLNAMTSFIGAPVVIWVVMRQRNNQ